MIASNFPNQMPVDLVMAYAAKRSGTLEATKDTPFQKELVTVLLEIAGEDKEFRDKMFLDLYGEDIETVIQRQKGENPLE